MPKKRFANMLRFDVETPLIKYISHLEVREKEYNRLSAYFHDSSRHHKQLCKIFAECSAILRRPSRLAYSREVLSVSSPIATRKNALSSAEQVVAHSFAGDDQYFTNSSSLDSSSCNNSLTPTTTPAPLNDFEGNHGEEKGAFILTADNYKELGRAESELESLKDETAVAGDHGGKESPVDEEEHRKCNEATIASSSPEFPSVAVSVESICNALEDFLNHGSQRLHHAKLATAHFSKECKKLARLFASEKSRVTAAASEIKSKWMVTKKGALQVKSKVEKAMKAAETAISRRNQCKNPEKLPKLNAAVATTLSDYLGRTHDYQTALTKVDESIAELRLDVEELFSDCWRFMETYCTIEKELLCKIIKNRYLFLRKFAQSVLSSTECTEVKIDSQRLERSESGTSLASRSSDKFESNEEGFEQQKPVPIKSQAIENKSVECLIEGIRAATTEPDVALYAAALSSYLPHLERARDAMCSLSDVFEKLIGAIESSCKANSEHAAVPSTFGRLFTAAFNDTRIPITVHAVLTSLLREYISIASDITKEYCSDTKHYKSECSKAQRSLNRVKNGKSQPSDSTSAKANSPSNEADPSRFSEKIETLIRMMIQERARFSAFDVVSKRFSEILKMEMMDALDRRELLLRGTKTAPLKQFCLPFFFNAFEITTPMDGMKLKDHKSKSYYDLSDASNKIVFDEKEMTIQPTQCLPASTRSSSTTGESAYLQKEDLEMKTAEKQFTVLAFDFRIPSKDSITEKDEVSQSTKLEDNVQIQPLTERGRERGLLIDFVFADSSNEIFKIEESAVIYQERCSNQLIGEVIEDYTNEDFILQVGDEVVITEQNEDTYTGLNGAGRLGIFPSSIVCLKPKDLPEDDKLLSQAKNTKFANKNRQAGAEIFDEEFQSKFKTKENLLQVYRCALGRKILLQGKLFLSQSYVGFVSSFNDATLFGGETRVLMNIKDIAAIRKRSNAIFFDNAIEFELEDGTTHFFASFVNRDKTLDYISFLWNLYRKLDENLAQTVEPPICGSEDGESEFVYTGTGEETLHDDLTAEKLELSSLQELKHSVEQVTIGCSFAEALRSIIDSVDDESSITRRLLNDANASNVYLKEDWNPPLPPPFGSGEKGTNAASRTLTFTIKARKKGGMINFKSSMTGLATRVESLTLFGGSTAAVSTTTCISGIPLMDGFELLTRYIFRKISPDRTALNCQYGVVCIKKSFFTSWIENEILPDLKSNCEHLCGLYLSIYPVELLPKENNLNTSTTSDDAGLPAIANAVRSSNPSEDGKTAFEMNQQTDSSAVGTSSLPGSAWRLGGKLFNGLSSGLKVLFHILIVLAIIAIWRKITHLEIVIANLLEELAF